MARPKHTSSDSSAAPLPASFQIDYDFNNKKVRQYTIADVNTVKQAIADHIGDFLTYHKVPAYYGYEYARWCFGLLIVIAGVFSYAYRHSAFLDNRPIYFVSAAVFGICTLAQIYISRFVEGTDTIFLSKPLANAPSKNKKAPAPPLQPTTLAAAKFNKKGDISDASFVKAYISRLPTEEEQEEEDKAEISRILAEQKEKDEKKKKGGKKVESQPAEAQVDEDAEEGEEEEDANATKDGAEKEDATEEKDKSDASEAVDADALSQNDDSKKKKKSKKTKKSKEGAADDTPKVVLSDPAQPRDFAKYVSLSPTGSMYTTPLWELMGKSHIRLRMVMEDAFPSFTLYADLLDSGSRTGFWSSPRVVTSVSKHLAFATFFDEEGFIHPPAIKEQTLSLLKELVAAAKDSKKRR